MSVFRRLSNLARGKVKEWQKSLDDTDPEEIVERAREAARRASERLEQALSPVDETLAPDPEPEPEPPRAEEEQPSTPAEPRKRRL